VSQFSSSNIHVYNSVENQIIITTVIGEGDESYASRALVRGCGCIGGVRGKHSASIVTNINKRSIP
jgi:hypothetical protein